MKSPYDVLDAIQHEYFEASIHFVDAPSVRGKILTLGFPCFALSKKLKKSPQSIAQDICADLKSDHRFSDYIDDVESLSGYVNISFRNDYISEYLEQMYCHGVPFFKRNPKHIFLEFSSPNLNKPLHLGHVRNNILGMAYAGLWQYAGHRVTKATLYNDRGIHICKALAAYACAVDAPPKPEDMKGDHWVGFFYTEYQRLLESEYETFPKGLGRSLQDFEQSDDCSIAVKARLMLKAWEHAKDAGEDPDPLWSLMIQQQARSGIEQTYRVLGTTFDVVQCESDFYQIGKELVFQGPFTKRLDGSYVYEPRDKTVLRADGTSLYITQDLGIAHAREAEFQDVDTFSYLVANEQDEYFKTLFHIFDALGSDRTYQHLSYGMVELPDGKMKSREGTVVDADEFIASLTKEVMKVKEGQDPEKALIIALSALKLYLLAYTPSSRVSFDPAKSISLTGHTGPYVLYTYARIRSLLVNVGLNDQHPSSITVDSTHDKVYEVFRVLASWPRKVTQALTHQDPSILVTFLYEVCDRVNSIYALSDLRLQSMPEGPEKDTLIGMYYLVSEALSKVLTMLNIQYLEEM
jgi:arginyl-tRNA synthetase